jgi:hypothetical protein
VLTGIIVFILLLVNGYIMDKARGGKGKKAPYESTHIRIPAPIKGRVEDIKDLYFSGNLDEYYQTIAENQRLADEYKSLSSDLKSLPSLDEAKDLVKQLLKQRKSAKETLAKFLSSLYSIDISKDDL